MAADVAGKHPAAIVCASPSAVVTIDPRDGGTEDTAFAFLAALGAATWQ